MGAFQVRLALRARRDAKQIGDYIAKNDPAVATTFVATLVEKAHELAIHHGLGTKLRGRPGFRKIV